MWCPFSNGWDDNLLSHKIMMLSVITCIYVITLEMSTSLWIISQLGLSCPLSLHHRWASPMLSMQRIHKKVFWMYAVKKEVKIIPAKIATWNECLIRCSTVADNHPGRWSVSWMINFLLEYTEKSVFVGFLITNFEFFFFRF